jgi:hypothetical protein
MNTPTHIAGGACLAMALVCVCSPVAQSRTRVAAVAAGALGVGVVVHLLLDLIPHFAWVVYLEGFKPLPFHWLLREAALGLAVALPALALSGRAWPYVALGMAGGLYPDVEKVLSVDFHVPDRFILFGWHSLGVSNRTAGLPKAVLIAGECLLLAGFLFAMWRMKNRASSAGAAGGG